jgi:hypothetical protein
MKLSLHRRFFHWGVAPVIGFFALSVATLQAGFVQIPQPDAAYTSSTTLLPIPGNDFDTTLTLSDSNLTVTFSTLMEVFTAETSWGTWGSPPATEGNMTKVLSPFDFTLTSVTMSFSQPLTTFGLEAEPDGFTQGSFPMRLDFFNGVTLLGTVSYPAVDPIGGAVLFAATSMTPITSATLTVEGNSNDPAGTDPGMARLRYALASTTSTVPETGSSIGLMLMAVLALFAVHRFRSQRTA